MKVITNWQTTLSASVTASQTTIPVSSIMTSDDTPHTITIADFDDGFGYMTIEPLGSKIELIKFTGITDNGDNSGILTGVTRGLAFYGGTETSVAANGRTHQAGSSIVCSDAHYYYDRLMDLTSAETVTGIKTFTVSPIVPTPTTDYQASTKAYVDSVAIAGAPDASTITKGISMISVAPVSPTSPIAVGDNDNRVSPVSLASLNSGKVDALVGTSGTPSTSNKYVTNDDTSETTASKLARIKSTGELDSSIIPIIYAFYGDGSDGDVTINSGSFTSGPITSNALTRDAYFDNLTVESTRTLNTAGYRLFVKGTLTNTGTIQNNGVNGVTDGVGGSGAPGVTIAGGSTGGASTSGLGSGSGGGGGGVVLIFAKTIVNTSGIIQANGGNGGAAGDPAGSGTPQGGNVGVDRNQGLGGVGGTGGTYDGVSGGGNGGGVTSPKTRVQDPRVGFAMYDFLAAVGIGGGSGGGSGGRTPTTGSGGGGGGGGGLVLLFYRTISLGTEQATGGIGGAAFGSGTSGATGAVGTVIRVAVT